MEESVCNINFHALPLSDDFMFGEVMRRPEICKLFLEALLGKEIARIEYITKQQDVSDSYTGHGIRLDVYLRDEANTIYSIEMQTSAGAAIFKRIRYYQGTIDRHNLKKSEHYSRLPESFIIMICTFDLIGRGMAFYKRKVTIEDCEDYTYDDGTHIFFLNSAYTIGNADEAILEFLRCIHTNDTEPEVYSSQLMKKVCPAIEEVRSDPGKEAEYMTWQTKIMDIEFEATQKGIEKGLEKGREEGLKEGRAETLEVGMRTLVETLHNLDHKPEVAERYLTEKYHISQEEARKKVASYWT